MWVFSRTGHFLLRGRGGRKQIVSLLWLTLHGLFVLTVVIRKHWALRTFSLLPNYTNTCKCAVHIPALPSLVRLLFALATLTVSCQSAGQGREWSCTCDLRFVGKNSYPGLSIKAERAPKPLVNDSTCCRAQLCIFKADGDGEVQVEPSSRNEHSCWYRLR